MQDPTQRAQSLVQIMLQRSATIRELRIAASLVAQYDKPWDVIGAQIASPAYCCLFHPSASTRCATVSKRTSKQGGDHLFQSATWQLHQRLQFVARSRAAFTRPKTQS